MSNAPLSDEDVEYLNATFPGRWNLNREIPGGVGLMITEYQVPAGYTPSTSELMVFIPLNYPVTKIDMFYFYPHLARSDGQAIDRLLKVAGFNRQWQAWSRHYIWEPSQHSLISHLEYVCNQLECDAR